MRASSIATLLSGAALLASGTAGAAVVNASVDYSGLQFRVIDLTPNDDIAAGFTLRSSWSSLQYNAFNANWGDIGTEYTQFPTASAPATSWTKEGKTFQTWSSDTAGHVSVAASGAGADGSGTALLRSGWAFDVAPGTALVITADVTSTLGQDLTLPDAQLSANTWFYGYGQLGSSSDPGTYNYGHWSTEWRSDFSPNYTYTKGMGVTLMNAGSSTLQGNFSLVARATAVAYVNGTAPIPEPATYMMLGAGLLVAGAAARRRRS